MRPLPALVPVLLALAIACGGATPDADRHDGTIPGDGEAGSGGDDGAAASVDHRGLALGANWGALVQAARQLDDTNQSDSDEACLLRGEGPYRLTGDIAVAIRPLPEAPDDLDARLASTQSARLFTRWGQLHPEGELAIVAFTGTMPPTRRDGMAIAVTDRGVYLIAAGAGEGQGPMPAEESAALVHDAVASSATVVVVAEAAVSLRTIRRVLASISPEHAARVALGVTLPEDVRMPEPTVQEDDGRGMCPDGLPAHDGAEGDLDPGAIVGALGPLRDGATECMALAGGPGAAGTRLGLAMRIGANGTLSEACFTADSASDPALRDCILTAARSTPFPVPSPAGSVDVLLPLQLEPASTEGRRLVCP